MRYAATDIQFHMGPAYYEDHGAESASDGHAMVIAPVLVAPKARGRVWLRSSEPGDKPRILTNSLSEPEDMASLVAGEVAIGAVAAANQYCCATLCASLGRQRHCDAG